MTKQLDEDEIMQIGIKPFYLENHIETEQIDIGEYEGWIKANEVKQAVKLLKKDTGCYPINSREVQIVNLFKERIDKIFGKVLTSEAKEK